ncbi:TetR/AcrR family transcriptional regulator (plasmid) [Agrobacterium tumefaciens]|nr:TetR/AcrR family transcriptional regulator [Agrobacterium tumefaciens]
MVAHRAAKAKINKKALLREESIQRLTRAAFGLIVTKGYHACTLQEIASTAGFTKGAVFFYFESKENILLHLLDIAESHIVDTLIEHVKGLKCPAPEKISAFFKYASKQGIDRPDELLCLIKMSIESRDGTDLADRRVREIYQRIYDLLEEVVEDGKKAGELSSTLPTKEFATLVVATHDGMMLEWHRRGGGIDGRRFVATVWSTFLNGILVRSPDK